MSEPEAVGTTVRKIMREMRETIVLAGCNPGPFELWDEPPLRSADPSSAGVPACEPHKKGDYLTPLKSKKENNMPVLTGLSGTNGKDRECVMVGSFSAILKALRLRLAATAAGDNGAINIWRDDAGLYRCAAMRFCRTIEERAFKTLKEIGPWAREWLGKIK